MSMPWTDGDGCCMGRRGALLGHAEPGRPNTREHNLPLFLVCCFQIKIAKCGPEFVMHRPGKLQSGAPSNRCFVCGKAALELP